MKHKGMSFLGVVAVVALILVAAAILVGIGIGIGKGGGKGDGEGSGDKPESSSQVESQTTIPLITTESVQYIEIVVEGNEYLFSNSRYSLDDIERLVDAVKKECKENDIQVQVRDDGASVKAYKTLANELKANNIHFTEKNEKE